MKIALLAVAELGGLLALLLILLAFATLLSPAPQKRHMDAAREAEHSS